MKFKHHFEPEQGWMNDPNGLCWFGGQYHAFFQYNPYAPKWGTMHWGHAVSEDLLNWRQVETALFPDQPYEDRDGCFSGSAIERDGELCLFYTAVSNRYKQTQAMAMSHNGMSFRKFSGNPIIKASPYADAEGKNKDFRDPKVFEAFGRYYMVLGTCTPEGEGQILLYSSHDLTDWSFESIVYATNEFGGTLECPDMFPLGDRWVVMFSAMKPTVAASVFLIGSFDGKCFCPTARAYTEYGKDFYAPQTFRAPDGRRVMIGWFYHWSKPLPAGAEVAGALSIPRELTLDGGRILNYPVREARHLLQKECPYVRVDGTEITILGLDGSIVLQRDLNGLNGIEKIDTVDILFDQKAVEIFVNGGVVSLSQWLI